MRGLIVIAVVSASAASAECRDDLVTLRGDFGTARIAVEVADDPTERSQGLMNRERMDTLAGMLFVYDAPQPVSFWMHNTLIPLDMIFAGADGTIRAIHENAIPLDRTPIPGGDDVQFVLEVNGGLVARLGIEPGATLQHPLIAQGAADPCN